MTVVTALSAALVTMLIGARIRPIWLDRIVRRRLNPIVKRPHRVRHGRLRFRKSRPEPDLAGFLDRIARQCSTGDSLASAFASSAAITSCSQVFEPSLHALGRGSRLSEALDQQPRGRGDDVSLTIHALSLCARNGGAVAEPLDRAAATLRSRQAMAHERAAQSAQARLSAKVLTLAPVGFACWSALSNSTIRGFLTTPAGAVCVGMGAALNAVGWLWMKRIVGVQP